jgi:hypothetical protein
MDNSRSPYFTTKHQMTDSERAEMREYAWRYFALHADQRLKTFNFFLILATVILGGVLAFLKDASIPWLAAPVGLLLFVLSLVFWRLDRRNRELIWHAENALRQIEAATPNDSVPAELKLFSHEEATTRKLRATCKPSCNPSSWWQTHYSYTDCFRIVFCASAILGLLVTGASFFLSIYQRPAQAPIPQQQFFIGAQPTTPK